MGTSQRDRSVYQRPRGHGRRDLHQLLIKRDRALGLPSWRRWAGAVHLIRMPRRPAVLLMSLVGHLLLLTTPLHAAMLAPGLDEPGHELLPKNSPRAGAQLVDELDAA